MRATRRQQRVEGAVRIQWWESMGVTAVQPGRSTSRSTTCQPKSSPSTSFECIKEARSFKACSTRRRSLVRSVRCSTSPTVSALTTTQATPSPRCSCDSRQAVSKAAASLRPNAPAEPADRLADQFSRRSASVTAATGGDADPGRRISDSRRVSRGSPRTDTMRTPSGSWAASERATVVTRSPADTRRNFAIKSRTT